MNLRTFLGSMIFIIGVMVIAASPALAEEIMMYSKTTFEPVHVARNVSNHVTVVNLSSGFSSDTCDTNADNKYQINSVVVKSFNLLGELQDEVILRDVADLPEPGMGVMVVLTDTIPDPHHSLVVVLVEFSPIINGSAVNGGSEVLDTNNTNELPFIVTSSLVTRNLGTFLQVKGVTELLNNGSSTPVE